MTEDNTFQILGFQKTSLLDYPGAPAAVVYVGGCNLRCPYCHNSSLVLKKDAEPWNIHLINKYLKAAMVRNVVITGGEPLLYADSNSFKSFITTLRANPSSIKLDTNGLLCQFRDLSFIDSLHYIAMDYKAPIPGYKYLISPFVSSVQEEILRNNIRFILKQNQMKIKHFEAARGELRTTVHSSLLSREDLRDMCSDLINIATVCGAATGWKPDEAQAGWIGSWYLQQYRQCDGFDPKLKDIPTYSDEELTDIAIELGAVVRGVRDSLVEMSKEAAVEKFKLALQWTDTDTELVRRCKKL